MEALRQDPTEFGKPGYDPEGRPLAQAKDLFPDHGPREKITHTKWAWIHIRFFVGLCIWYWGLIAFSHLLTKEFQSA